MLTAVNHATMGERMRQVFDGRCTGGAVRAAALMGVLTIALATLTANPAQAGTWMRPACVNPDGSGTGSDGWSAFIEGSPPLGGVANTSCGIDVPMTAYLGMPMAADNGDGEALRYTPPRGSSLAGGTVYLGATADGTGSAAGSVGVFTPHYASPTTDDLVLLCLHSACLVRDAPTATPDFLGTLQLPSDRGGDITLLAACVGSAHTLCNSGGSHGVWAGVTLAWARLLLSTTSLPTAADFRGGLLEPDAHGTAGLAFTASEGVDGGPGVYRVTVAIDDKPVYDGTPNTNSGACVPGGTDEATGALFFASQQPCPLTQTVDLAIKTTTLADGPHELKVTLLNAAQNSSTVLRRTISTNNRTTVSSTLTSDRTPTAGPGAPTPEYAVVLDAATRTLVRGVSRGWAKSGLRLSGTLRNSGGVPAPGVLVTLFARNGGEKTHAVVARMSTDSAGHWVIAAPRGPSRLLTVVYGEQPDAASPRAIKLRETVKPGLTLRVQALGRGRLRFSGKLSIKPLGSPRPLVVVQTRTRNGKHWQAVGTSIRVKPSGAYSVTYDGGPNVIGGTYSFRTVANATSLFATSISPIRRKAAR